MTNTEATSGLSEDGESMTFTVTGFSSGTATIPYTVYAIAPNPLDTPTGSNRFPNEHISAFISYTNSNNSQPIVNNISIPTVVNDAVNSSPGWAIATGTIKAGTVSEQRDTYTLKMFVNDNVRISDTETSVSWNGSSKTTNYCASPRVMSEDDTPTYVSGCKISTNGSLLGDTQTGSTLPVYKTMYYSLKVKVVGTA